MQGACVFKRIVEGGERESAPNQELFGYGGSMIHPVSTPPGSFVRGGSRMRPPCGSSGSCIERNTSAAAS